MIRSLNFVDILSATDRISFERSYVSRFKACECFSVSQMTNPTISPLYEYRMAGISNRLYRHCVKSEKILSRVCTQRQRYLQTSDKKITTPRYKNVRLKFFSSGIVVLSQTIKRKNGGGKNKIGYLQTESLLHKLTEKVEEKRSGEINA